MHILLPIADATAVCTYTAMLARIVHTRTQLAYVVTDEAKQGRIKNKQCGRILRVETRSLSPWQLRPK